MSVLISVAACSRPVAMDPIPTTTLPASELPVSAGFVTPSPDPLRVLPDLSVETYIVRNGDTLGAIALEYNATPEAIAELNGLADVASIGIGQALKVPIAGIEAFGPATKIAPDGEIVYGPSAAGFDVDDFVSRTGGFLRSYTEEVEGEVLTGAQIVQQITERYSVGPRTLLALIEYRGKWLSNPTPDSGALFYPVGHADERWSGLNKQLMWAADHLNDGYYDWKTRGRQTIRLSDSSRVRIAPGLNAGTIGLQTLLAIDSTPDQWLADVGPDGFVATYRAWFGDPFAGAT